MKTVLNIVNGILISVVTGYSLIDFDWQAWVLALFYILSIEAIEFKTQDDIQRKMTPTLDNIENALKRFYSRG